MFILNILNSQNSWDSIPCFDPSLGGVTGMLVDKLNNKIVLNFLYDSSICNNKFKGILAYNGSGFETMDFGIETHNYLSTWTGGAKFTDCITYQGKTLFSGNHTSVGKNVLYSKCLTYWDGIKWYAMQGSPFKNDYTVFGLLNDETDINKFWIYGAFDSIAGKPAKNIAFFNGNTYTPINMPVMYNSYIYTSIYYKNEIYFSGIFGDSPFGQYEDIIRYKNGNWLPVGNGVPTSVGGVFTMAVYKDTLYIGGYFSKQTGNAGNFLMKWDGTRLSDAGFGNFDNESQGIRKLIVYNDRLYAFGPFNYVNGQKCFGAAYYQNGKWTAGKDTIGGINNAVVYNNELYVSGTFTINNNQNLRHFVKLRCPDFNNCTNSSLNDINNPKIFPNPFTNKLTINTNTSDQNTLKKVTLTNLLGQTIYTTEFYQNNTTLDLSQIPSGAYIATIYLNNKFNFRTKLIKH